jgi:hypothetical protein
VRCRVHCAVKRADNPRRRNDRYEDALPHLVRVCHIWEESMHGDMCVGMLGPLAAMGACLFSLERLEDAQAVREQAMAVAEATLDPDSPRWLLVIAACVQNLCRCASRPAELDAERCGQGGGRGGAVRATRRAGQ